MDIPKTHSPFVRNLYFLIGIIATLAYRVIVVVDDRALVQIFWYVGTIGFIIYFLHRYQVSQKRARLVTEYDLISKINALQELSTEDKLRISYIFNTLSSTKEKWNSVVIFASSAIALVVGIIFDFIVK